MTLQRHDNLITKTYLDKALNKVIGSIAEILNDLIQKMEGRFDRIEGRLNKVEGKVDKLEVGQINIQRQLTDLKIDTPTQKEFNELKTKVNHYHPAL